LREENNRVHPVGLFDLDRNIRPVGHAYKKLIAQWRGVLPTQSVCLRVPVSVPLNATDHNSRFDRVTAPANTDG